MSWAAEEGTSGSLTVRPVVAVVSSGDSGILSRTRGSHSKAHRIRPDVPVFSGVLAPHHFHEHDEHGKQFIQHFVTKGKELADALASTLATLASL